MTIKNTFFFILLACASLKTQAQSDPFQISLQSMNFDPIAIQSFAWASHNNNWLVIGGRKDGLHRRQPWASFDSLGLNHEITVIDPARKQKWSVSTQSLSASIREQLSSTNMQFYQDGNTLYLIGGYGYSRTANNHITYPHLIAIQVSELINAVKSNGNIQAYIKQISHQSFAVTGGYLAKIYDTYYLVGGHRFDGRYNPMNNPTFTQTYTNAILQFKIKPDSMNLSVTFLKTIIDSQAFHRRDYNLAAQIMPNGEQGLTVFSGVFQQGVNLPYLNPVNIDSSGYSVNSTFAQYYNHYHCAHIPLYSATKNEMHTLFFGGIAQYYDNAGVLTQDNEVPFVKTIARVNRDAFGQMSEYKLPVNMPGFLGAGSEFIPVDSIPTYSNGVIQLDKISSDSLCIGYILGGINSTAANIFFTNDGTQSVANSAVYKVYLIKNQSNSFHQINAQSINGLNLQVSPNPNQGIIHIQFDLIKNGAVLINLYTADGKKIAGETKNNLIAGRNNLQLFLDTALTAGMYYIEIITEEVSATQKIIMQP